MSHYAKTENRHVWGQQVDEYSVLYLYNREGGDEGVSFYSIPSIVENQGEGMTEHLSRGGSHG